MCNKFKCENFKVKQVVRRLRDAVCRKRHELWGKPDFDVAQRQRASLRVTPCPQSSGKTRDNRRAPPTLLPSIYFPVCKVEVNLERTSFANETKLIIILNWISKWNYISIHYLFHDVSLVQHRVVSFMNTQ